MTVLETARRADSPSASSFDGGFDPEFGGDLRAAPDWRADLGTALGYATAVGALLVLMLTAARGSHALIGWLPLWLVGMPALAWWALNRFRLPAWGEAQEPAAAQPARRRRRGSIQARRRNRPAAPRPLPRVA
ncbi:hypothetical protein GLE_4540 [Lysobacter enzymogenes]|uniref:Uncharacterized protein n=1 Tax=Lysobacter enzymogenes TaxID=69 RepID=A0A0S2DN92_LYSEN|nr:hypothetical protein [Lysobacter enzymogenes]ALN59881.1 hypothetical protein GLE_4540 [Lysobacter enzymogenes]